MLTSAADYKYITTTGIEQALVGNIIPTAELLSCQAAFRFEDFCYISEATRDWSFNYSSIRNQLNPSYTQSQKFSQLFAAWQFIYKNMQPSNTDYQSSYGCCVYLNDNITQMPVQPIVSKNTGYLYDKAYFNQNAPTLMFDYTSIMDACQYQRSPSQLNLGEQPIAVIVPHILYWILFQPVWQQVKSALDGQTVYYDKAYTFCQRGMKSGTGQWNESDNGIISTHTGSAVNQNFSYVSPAIQRGVGGGYNTSYLSWYNWYQTISGEYQSGYEYCYDGLTSDAYAYVDFRSDDVLDAYAFVEYIAINENNYREIKQYKFEHLTNESGRRWSFKCYDKTFAQALLETHGADFNNIGTRSPRSDSIPKFRLTSRTYDIYVKYNHKYAQGISEQWQWQPS